ncbi:MAG: hypothetical protein M1826_003746 [Phylliscum demangeonii]|nr:MAG: hypothetical protein M1826_003746 [Phylliscum demangeonii]
MASVDREGSRDREPDRTLKHQQSFSESGRPHVPMWDSSDPDRAPPPLPLNPSSPGTLTRPNASSTVVAAAAALSEKARESAGPSPYTTNPMPAKRDTSPEKSLIRGHHHKRMQSLHPAGGSVRDLGSHVVDGGAVRFGEPSPERTSSRFGEPSPERATGRFGDASPERTSARSGSVPSTIRDYYRDAADSSPERSPSKSTTTTTALPYAKEAPALRPSARSPTKSLLGGEHPATPPPSATMLALHNMPTATASDDPMSTVTKSSSLARAPQTYDVLSTQILSLTGIATNLQREMMQLSRRSKDNATDLVSLKEATNARDEDIRQCLRELVANLSSALSGSTDGRLRVSHAQTERDPGGFLLDNKPHASPPTMRTNKSFTLPHIPSPSSFTAVLERELAGSPSPYSMDGAANLALLEKILREMGTKEGQDRLFVLMSQMAEKSSRARDGDSDGDTTKRLDDIASMLKESLGSLAVVKTAGAPEDAAGTRAVFDAEPAGPLVRASKDLGAEGAPDPTTKPSPARRNRDLLLADDVQSPLRRLKDSMVEHGGLTAEVKALVRELRGEVLGMGREMARKLDEMSARASSGRGNGNGPSSDLTEREGMAMIVQDGLADLKDHMERLMDEKLRPATASATSRNLGEAADVFDAVQHAIGQLHPQSSETPGPALSRDDILDAMREGWEVYKPEIELQNFGLERDEILQCLKEGLEEHRPASDATEGGALSRQDLLDAVREGLERFTPPQPIVVPADVSMSREQMHDAVREALETFDFPAAGPPPAAEMTREHMLDAAREGLHTFDFPVQAAAGVTRDPEISKTDVYDAIREGLAGTAAPAAGIGQEVLERLHEVVEGMRIEFKGVSDEAKQNVAANGRDTEQVLDALKDGLEQLRTANEADTEHVLDAVAHALAHLQTARSHDSEQMLESQREGLERLRADVELYVDRAADVTGKDEIIETLKLGLDKLRSDVDASIVANSGAHDAPSTADGERLDDVKAEIGQLRELVATTLLRISSAADKDEIMDTIRLGLDDVRSDLARRTDRAESVVSGTGEILDAITDGLDALRSDLEKARATPVDTTVWDEILRAVKDGVAEVRDDLHRLGERTSEPRELSPERGQMVIADDGLKRNDIQNLELMLAQLRVKVEALDTDTREPPPPTAPTAPPSQVPPNVACKEDVQGLAEQLRAIEGQLKMVAERAPTADERTTAASKEDVEAIETLLLNTKAKLDAMATPPDAAAEETAKKEDVEAVELLLRDIKDAIDELSARTGSQPAAAQKEDLAFLETLLRDVKAGVDAVHDGQQASTTEEKVTRTDLDAIEGLCMDIKVQVDQLALPDPALLPTKLDFCTLQDAMHEQQARARHDAERTIKAVEDRQLEFIDLSARLGELKAGVVGLEGALAGRLDDHGLSVQTLGRVLAGLEEQVAGGTTATATVGSELRDLLETVAREFERGRGLGESTQREQEQQAAELQRQLDDRFAQLRTQADEAQRAAAAAHHAAHERAAAVDATVAGTRAVADDLKLSADTLGITLTEAVDKMAQDAKTVFHRVEDTWTTLDEMRCESADGRAHARADADLVRARLDAVHSQLRDHQPPLAAALNDVLLIVRQLLALARPPAPERVVVPDGGGGGAPDRDREPEPALIRDMPDKYDDAAVHVKLDELMRHAAARTRTDHDPSALRAALGPLLDQTPLHAKLDQLLQTTPASLARVLDQIQQHVAQTAAPPAASPGIMAQHERERERVEHDVAQLTVRKEGLQQAIAALQAEQATLATQKMRLAADVASLETARRLRHEELAGMEARAAALERRVLETIIDHSRALLLARPTPTAANANATDAGANHKIVSLKRVSSGRHASLSSPSASASAPAASSPHHQALTLALRARPSPLRTAGPPSASAGPGRRILSLNQISSHVPTGAAAAAAAAPSSSLVVPVPAFGGFGNLKRSHSVKAGGGVRKSSVGGPGRYDYMPAATNHNNNNKENDDIAGSEEDDDDHDDGDDQSGGGDGYSLFTDDRDVDATDDDDDATDTDTITVTAARSSRTPSFGSASASVGVGVSASTASTRRRTSAGSTTSGSGSASRRSGAAEDSLIEEEGEDDDDDDDDGSDEQDDDDDDEYEEASSHPAALQPQQQQQPEETATARVPRHDRQGSSSSRGDDGGAHDTAPPPLLVYDGVADSGVGEEVATADLVERRFAFLPAAS